MKLMMEPIDVAETQVMRPKGQVSSTKGQVSSTKVQGGWVLGDKPVPKAVCWRGRLFEVESVLEEWTARGEWWGKEDRRDYFLLLTSNGVLEVFKGSQGWMLSRVFD